MTTFAQVAAALAFPCLIILVGVLVALRRGPRPVPWKTIALFLGLGVVALILGGFWLIFAEAVLIGLVNIAFYYAFVTASLPEEGFRYLVIRWGLAKRSRIGFVNAMLLGSLVGLILATVEHVGYAVDKGWQTWLARSFTSAPYHVLSGAVMGYCCAIAIRTKRPWGLACALFLILVHGIADWPLEQPDSDAPSTRSEFVNSGWAGNIASLVVVTVMAFVFARSARKMDAKLTFM